MFTKFLVVISHNTYSYQMLTKTMPNHMFQYQIGNIVTRGKADCLAGTRPKFSFSRGVFLAFKSKRYGNLVTRNLVTGILEI